MLQLMESQRVRHKLVTEQQQKNKIETEKKYLSNILEGRMVLLLPSET